MSSLKIHVLLLCCLIYACAASGQQLERQVIASAGGSNEVSSFTVGEVIVSTSNLEVTTGFQQPSFMTEPVTAIRDITKELQVYPVPTQDIVTITGLHFQGSSTEFTLYTQEGKIVDATAERFESEMKLDLNKLPSGNYYLTLINKSSRTIAKYKILKIK